MKKHVFLALIIGFTLLTLGFGSHPVRAAIERHVPYDYTSIQAAVDASADGDTVRVHGGVYHEHVVVPVRLTLVGEGGAIVDGDGLGTVVNVTSSNVVIQGFTIRNSGGNWTQRDSGVYMRTRQFCIVENNVIENCRLGVYLAECTQITVYGNRLFNNIEGIRLDLSTYCTIERNEGNGNAPSIILSGSTVNLVKCNVVRNSTSSGIHLQAWSSDNTIYGNWMSDCGHGLLLSQSDNNIIYHNSFVNNIDQAWMNLAINNQWDTGWPDGGNYWNDHNNADVKAGQYQSDSGSDGIADAAYTVETDNIDRYPCAGPIMIFDVEWLLPEQITVICNSTVSDFLMNITEKTIKFLVSDGSGVGFCRVGIPTTIISGLWHGNYAVLVNDTEIDFGNWTHAPTTYIYFRYYLPTKQIVLIPENLWPAMPLLMVTTLSAALMRQKKPKSTNPRFSSLDCP